MRRKAVLIGTALVFFVLAPVVGRTAGAQTVQEVVQAVEAHYRDLTDVTARVSQKNILRSVGRTQTFDGMLRIKKPGRLRLEFTNGQLIVVSGKAALLYSRKSSQVIKRTFTDFEHMNIPVAFLLGAAHIRDDFDVLQPDPKTPRSLELLPKRTGAAMRKLSIRTDEAGRILSLTILDRSGNTTEIAFMDFREDTGLDDAQFSFSPPKGTEVIEQ